MIHIPPMGSIPTANRCRRNHLVKLSSMRAATRTGLVFVGGNLQHNQTVVTSDFQPRTIKSKPQVCNRRQALHVALMKKAHQLEELIISAENNQEIEFWKQELEQLRLIL